MGSHWYDAQVRQGDLSMFETDAVLSVLKPNVVILAVNF